MVAGSRSGGLPNLNFHVLKHAARTALLEEGVNIRATQERLGHANPRTTLAVFAQATKEAAWELSYRRAQGDQANTSR